MVIWLTRAFVWTFPCDHVVLFSTAGILYGNEPHLIVDDALGEKPQIQEKCTELPELRFHAESMRSDSTDHTRVAKLLDLVLKTFTLPTLLRSCSGVRGSQINGKY